MADPTNGARRGNPNAGRVPMTLEQLRAYNPNRPDATEALWQPFYDFATYPAIGSTQLTFFQLPKGQGGKTLADTNMTLAGQFPAPTAFLLTGIMVPFFPGNPTSATAAAAVADENWNDVVDVANSGWLELTIGSKPYLIDAPVGKFPANFTISGESALASSGADDSHTRVDFARPVGRYYEITPFLIPQSQNFSVTLNWPALVPVNVAARIGVILDGFYYRQSQ